MLLSAEERRGRISSSIASTLRRGASASAGAIIGEPGVCNSSSIGRGSRGGLVRWYDRASIGGTLASMEDEYGDFATADSVVVFVVGMGTATGWLGRSLTSTLCSAVFDCCPLVRSCVVGEEVLWWVAGSGCAFAGD